MVSVDPTSTKARWVRTGQFGSSAKLHRPKAKNGGGVLNGIHNGKHLFSSNKTKKKRRSLLGSLSFSIL